MAVCRNISRIPVHLEKANVSTVNFSPERTVLIVLTDLKMCFALVFIILRVHFNPARLRRNTNTGIYVIAGSARIASSNISVRNVLTSNRN